MCQLLKDGGRCFSHATQSLNQAVSQLDKQVTDYAYEQGTLKDEDIDLDAAAAQSQQILKALANSYSRSDEKAERTYLNNARNASYIAKSLSSRKSLAAVQQADSGTRLELQKSIEGHKLKEAQELARNLALHRSMEHQIRGWESEVSELREKLYRLAEKEVAFSQLKNYASKWAVDLKKRANGSYNQEEDRAESKRLGDARIEYAAKNSPLYSGVREQIVEKNEAIRYLTHRKGKLEESNRESKETYFGLNDGQDPSSARQIQRIREASLNYGENAEDGLIAISEKNSVGRYKDQIEQKRAETNKARGQVREGLE